jgi:TadE-like protein
MRMSQRELRRDSDRKRRSGSLTVEMIVVFPILLALLVGMIEFSMILFSRQQLTAASREGARVAALGGELSDVERTVVRYLGDGRLGDAQVIMTDAAGHHLATADAVPSGEPVEVWVRLPANHSVPDLLAFLGYSIRNDEIVARTVMRRE